MNTFSIILGVTLLNGPVAQFPNPVPPQQQPLPQRPVISPYLNLLNNNRPAYQNYYQGVLPLQQLNNLSQQVTGLQNTPQAQFPGTGSELSTGKNVGYFTHRGYFMNFGGVGVQRSLAGQYSTAGNNALYSPTQQQPYNPSVMPFRK